MKCSIGFSTTSSLASKTIRLIAGGKTTHCYVGISDKFLGIPVVLHSDYNGVVIESRKIFDQRNITLIEFEFDSDNTRAAITNNMKYLGLKYDYRALKDWAWALMFQKWVEKKIERPFDDPKKIICVDFAIKVLNDMGESELPLGRMIPTTFLQWCEENYEAKGWVRNEVT